MSEAAGPPRAGDTLQNLLRAGIQALAAHPVRGASAASDARELLSRLIGVPLAALSDARTPAPGADSLATWGRWLERRLAGEPVQYITGRAAFRSLDLAVDPRVLIPRPETEGLVEAVLEALRAAAPRWPRPRVLDLGTGSGAIALAIASEFPAARVTATDASAAALEVARANAESLGLASRVRFTLGDWFDAPGAEERFEVVVSNPPYIAEDERGALPEDVREHEPAEALYLGLERHRGAARDRGTKRRDTWWPVACWRSSWPRIGLTKFSRGSRARRTGNRPSCAPTWRASPACCWRAARWVPRSHPSSGPSNRRADLARTDTLHGFRAPIPAARQRETLARPGSSSASRPPRPLR